LVDAADGLGGGGGGEADRLGVGGGEDGSEEVMPARARAGRDGFFVAGLISGSRMSGISVTVRSTTAGAIRDS
jgi:hypothetical protein